MNRSRTAQSRSHCSVGPGSCPSSSSGNSIDWSSPRIKARAVFTRRFASPYSRQFDASPSFRRIIPSKFSTLPAHSAFGCQYRRVLFEYECSTRYAVRRRASTSSTHDFDPVGRPEPDRSGT